MPTAIYKETPNAGPRASPNPYINYVKPHGRTTKKQWLMEATNIIASDDREIFSEPAFPLYRWKFAYIYGDSNYE